MNLKKIGSFDGAILGGVLGLMIAKPDWASAINSFLTSIIPASIGTNIFGGWTVMVYAIVIGLIVGYITERSR